MSGKKLRLSLKEAKKRLARSSRKVDGKRCNESHAPVTPEVKESSKLPKLTTLEIGPRDKVLLLCCTHNRIVVL